MFCLFWHDVSAGWSQAGSPAPFLKIKYFTLWNWKWIILKGCQCFHWQLSGCFLDVCIITLWRDVSRAALRSVGLWWLRLIMGWVLKRWTHQMVVVLFSDFKGGENTTHTKYYNCATHIYISCCDLWWLQWLMQQQKRKSNSKKHQVHFGRRTGWRTRWRTRWRDQLN